MKRLLEEWSFMLFVLQRMASILLFPAVSDPRSSPLRRLLEYATGSSTPSHSVAFLTSPP